MNKKKVIFLVSVIILFTIVGLFVFYVIKRNSMVVVEADSMKKVEFSEQIDVNNIEKRNINNVYAEGDSFNYKYKVVYTLEDNKVINSCWIIECFDEEYAIQITKNKETNSLWDYNLKREKNILTYNSTTGYGITLEELLLTLESAKVITVF